MQEYADPVIDWLDGGRGMFAKRLFRDVRPRSTADPHAINHPVLPLTVSLTTTPPFSSDWRSGLLFTALQSCVQHTNGAYMKDLACMGEDLESVALIDNSPISYALNQGSSAASAALPSSLPDRRWIFPPPLPSSPLQSRPQRMASPSMAGFRTPTTKPCSIFYQYSTRFASQAMSDMSSA